MGACRRGGTTAASPVEPAEAAAGCSGAAGAGRRAGAGDGCWAAGAGARSGAGAGATGLGLAGAGGPGRAAGPGLGPDGTGRGPGRGAEPVGLGAGAAGRSVVGDVAPLAAELSGSAGLVGAAELGAPAVRAGPGRAPLPGPRPAPRAPSGPPAGGTNASRSLRATGASTVEDGDFTYSPRSCSLLRTCLLVTPSSFASSCTRALPATALLLIGGRAASVRSTSYLLSQHVHGAIFTAGS